MAACRRRQRQRAPRHGAGREGKTRLCGAIARLAYEDGAVVAYRSLAGSTNVDLHELLEPYEMVSQPTLVVLDDLGERTSSAFEALRRLRRAARLPLLVVGAVSTRPGPLPAELGAVLSEAADAHRPLGPLGRAAVQEIVSLYEGRPGVLDVVDEILAASGGVPRLVHDRSPPSGGRRETST